MKGSFDFIPPKNWINHSADVKATIRKLLVPEVKDRCTMAQLKEDSWCGDAIVAAIKEATPSPAPEPAPEGNWLDGVARFFGVKSDQVTHDTG